MTTGWTAAAALLLFGGLTPALAQEPAKLIDPHDKNAVRPAPGIELGFYDPATGLFTRGMPLGSTSGSEVEGVLTMGVEMVVEVAIAKLATAFCGSLYELGHPEVHQSSSDVSQFTANHFASGYANFAVGQPDKSISVPYAYTPNSNSAQLSSSLSCQVTDSNNVTHSAGVSLGLEKLPSGNVTRRVRITM